MKSKSVVRGILALHGEGGLQFGVALRDGERGGGHVGVLLLLSWVLSWAP